ncbi:hypothetical protein H1R20_g15420, partial [Candolleomyces eurysporus]
MSDTDDHISVDELVMGQDQDSAPPEAPTAKTLLCNRCQMMIFGQNDLAPTACCADLFCNHCWTAILRDDERCRQFGCQNQILKKARIYLAEDSDDLLSREQVIVRQLELESDLLHKRITEEIGRLQVRIERQKQQLEDHAKMNGVLDDQIRQGIDRLQTLRNETQQLKEMFEATEGRTSEIQKTNDELEGQIQVLKKQTQLLEKLATREDPQFRASEGGSSQA